MMGQLAAVVSSDVVLAAIDGEARALELLAEAYWPVAYRLAVAVLGHRGPDAEDAAQDATLALTRGVRNLADPTRIKAWGTVIAIRSARRVKRRQGTSVPLAEGYAVAASGRPEDMIDMETALRSLSSDLRIALVLHVVFGYTSIEAGAILGVPDGTVRYRISRARERLRTALSGAPDPAQVKESTNDAAVR